MLQVKRRGGAASSDAGVLPANSTTNYDEHPQTRIPVITGEAHFKGTLAVEGPLLGQLGSGGGTLSLRQKTKSFFAAEPEISGEIIFRDTLRVNGYIAGSVHSRCGTLIVDSNARIDANIDVAVAVIGGVVKGDLVARERVELGPGSKIYGNIRTRSISIKPGAIFEGVCRMIDERGN